MSTQSNWLSNVLPKIQNARASFNKKDAKKFQLELLERIIKRIDGFSIECSECQSIKQQITEIANQLSGLPYTPREIQKDYQKKIQMVLLSTRY